MFSERFGDGANFASSEGGDAKYDVIQQARRLAQELLGYLPAKEDDDGREIRDEVVAEVGPLLLRR